MFNLAAAIGRECGNEPDRNSLEGNHQLDGLVQGYFISHSLHLSHRQVPFSYPLHPNYYSPGAN